MTVDAVLLIAEILDMDVLVRLAETIQELDMTALIEVHDPNRLEGFRAPRFMIGQFQVVVMNRGARNGLAPGDILTVFQSGEVVKDRVEGGRVKLPDEDAGTVMVFKVYDRIGYGLVMEATMPIHVMDAVRNPY